MMLRDLPRKSRKMKALTMEMGMAKLMMRALRALRRKKTRMRKARLTPKRRFFTTWLTDSSM